MEVNSADTALVITDPQNDFLNPKGVFWDAVKASVRENNTIENIDTMFRTAKDVGMLVFIFTEAMFFAGLISAHTIVKSQVAGQLWPPYGQPRLPVV